MRVRDRIGLNFPPLLLRIMLGVIVLWMGLGKLLGTFEVDGQRAATLANMGVITPASAKPAEPAKPAETKPAETKPPEGKTGARAPLGYSITLVAQPAKGQYTAADFPEPVKVRTLYVLALYLASVGEPLPDGKPPATIVPAMFTKAPWPVYLAWTAAVIETLAGVGLLVGLMTRLWALLLAGRMLAAIWLVLIGPAIQSGHTVLGFLPDYPAFDAEKWKAPMLQFALLMASAALLFLGPGRASLDHAIFAPPREDDDEEAE